MKKSNNKNPKNEAEKRYYEEKIHSTSFIRLNKIERKALADYLLKGLKSPSKKTQDLAGIVSLSYSLGLSFKQVLRFKITDFSDDFTTLRLKLNLSKEQWKSGDKNAFQAFQKYINTPIQPSIAFWLSARITDRRIKQIQSHLSEKITLNDVEKYILALRKTHSTHIELVRITAALKSELYARTGNATLTYLLTSKSNYRPPHSRFYYVPNFEELLKAWHEAQFSLWDYNQHVKKDIFYDGVWNGFVLKKGTLQAFTQRISVQKSTKDFIAFHNHFTKYTISMLCWNLGHRPVRDPFCEEELIDLDLKLVLINDKRKHGSDNFRVLPVPEILKTQYNHYQEHLKSLYKWLKKSGGFTHITEYLKEVLNKKSNHDHKRLFFLLNDDATQLIPIKKTTLKSFFKNNELPVPPNFGRHHIATHLANSKCISYMTVQIFLGHSMRAKTSLLSPVCLHQSLSEIKDRLNIIIHRDGWKAIPGYTTESAKEICNQCDQTQKLSNEAFFPKDLPGPKLRKTYLENQEKKIVSVSKKIETYLKKITSQKKDQISRDDEYEQQLTLEMKHLDFPHHHVWKDLLNFIKDEFDYNNPLPGLLRFNSFTSGISSLKKSSLNNYSLSLKDTDIWLEWLNKQCITYIKDSDSEKTKIIRIKTILCLNAAILGGASRKSVILGIAQKRDKKERHSYKLFQTENIMHVEIYRHEKYQIKEQKYWEKLWIDRWIPDPFSSILLSRLVNSQQISVQRIEKELKKLKNELKLSFSLNSPILGLYRTSHGSNMIEKPLYEHAIQSAKSVRRPMNFSSWTRHLTGRKFNLIQDTRHSDSKLTKNERNTTFNTPNQFKILLDLIKDEIKPILQTSNGIRKHQCLRIENKLLDIESSLNNPPLTLIIFFSWAITLCQRGTRGFNPHGKLRLKDDTLNTYISFLFERLFIDQDYPKLEQITSEEITAFYKNLIITYSQKSQGKRLKQLIYMFHKQAEENFSINECDWEELGGIPIRYSLKNSGEFVTLKEYKKLLSILSKSATPSEQTKTLNTLFVAIMTYRFGLRPAEAIRLKSNELIFNSSGDIEYVIVQKNFFGDTKTDKATRQVPCAFTLLDFEQYIIRNLYERGLAYSQLTDNFSLVGSGLIHETSHELSKLVANLSIRISTTLKHITGDSSVSTYSLRHSFVTNLNANLIHTENYQDALTKHYNTADISYFYENDLIISSHKSGSISVGHSSISTTYQTYSHHHDLVDKYNVTAFNKIDDQVFSFFLEKPLTTFRAQKSRYDSVHNAVISYLKKEDIQSAKQLTTKPVRVNRLDIKNISIKKASLLNTMDFLIIKSRNGKQSHTSLLSNSTQEKIVNAVVKFQQHTHLASLISNIQQAKNSEIFRACQWVQKNHLELEKLNKSKTTNKKLTKQLTLWGQCLNENNGKWVVLNENEVTSLTSLLNNLDIKFAIEERTSSRKKACSKNNTGILLNNHAANSSHRDESRKKNGYEISLKLSESIKTTKTVNVILIIISIYLFSHSVKGAI